MPNKPATFNRAYSLKYGVRVSERDPISGEAQMYVCMFCEHFGRDVSEEDDSRKRRRTARTKFYKKKFYTQNVVKHVETQHSLQWDKYKKLSQQEKGRYFATGTPLKSTLLAHMEKNDAIFGVVHPDIVENLLGNMFVQDDDDDFDLSIDPSSCSSTSHQLNFDCDDIACDNDAMSQSNPLLETAKQRALKVFKKTEENDGTFYTYKTSNSTLFGLVMDYIAAGMSFRLASHAITATRERIQIGSIGSVNPLKVANIVRIICADSFQSLRDILSSSWCFSVAMDMATHQGSAYLDIRVRVPGMKSSENFHVACVPFRMSHTGRNMANCFCELFDTLSPNWRKQLLSITTDGAANMTGNFKGVAKLIADECENDVIRIWCGAHQLDLSIQRFFKQLLGSEGLFHDRLNAIIAYLRRQYSLQAEMGSQCPKVATTRWLSMGVVLSWFTRHYNTLAAHFAEKMPTCTPSPEWWIQGHIVHSIAARANITFKSLQDANLTLMQQRLKIFELEQYFVDRFNIKTLDEADDAFGNLDEEDVIVYGNFKASKAKVASDFGDNCIGDGVDWNDDLSGDQRNEIAASYTKAILQFTEELHKLHTSSMQMNQMHIDYADIPLRPVDVVTQVNTFGLTLRCMKPRLTSLKVNRPEYNVVHSINKEAQDLRVNYPAYELTKVSDGDVTFEAAWWPKLRQRFPKLFKFCCGLSTMFPGTSTVESDFSIVNYEKNNRRTGLSDLALQGIVHAKQYERLRISAKAIDTHETEPLI